MLLIIHPSHLYSSKTWHNGHADYSRSLTQLWYLPGIKHKERRDRQSFAGQNNNNNNTSNKQKDSNGLSIGFPSSSFICRFHHLDALPVSISERIAARQAKGYEPQRGKTKDGATILPTFRCIKIKKNLENITRAIGHNHSSGCCAIRRPLGASSSRYIYSAASRVLSRKGEEEDGK